MILSQRQEQRDGAGRNSVPGARFPLSLGMRRDGGGEANVTMRGVTPMGIELRPQVKLVSGRWFAPGTRECVVSRKMANRFANTDPGQKFKTGPTELTVVGWFDGGDSAFDCWWGDPYRKGQRDATLGPLERGPFYAFEIHSGCLGTKGGPRVDPDGAVLNVDGVEIPGLYAAGEMVGGLFYTNYPGGSGLMSGAVFGRTAGASAARSIAG